MDKQYDIFVYSDSFRNYPYTRQHDDTVDFVLGLLSDRLHGLEFKSVELSQCKPDELTDEIREKLLQGPILICEHHITKRFNFIRPEDVKVFTSPFDIKPGPAAFKYANLGKRPNMAFHIAGRIGSGKSIMVHQLKLILENLIPGIQVIECSFDDGVDDKWDITTDPVEYNDYIIRCSNNKVLLGGKPEWTVGRFDQVFCNVKL